MPPPLTWSAPSTQEVKDAISNLNREQLRLLNDCKHHNAAILSELCNALGVRDAPKQRMWLLRLWRNNVDNVRSICGSRSPSARSTPSTLSSSSLDECSSSKKTSLGTHLIQLREDEWREIAPAERGGKYLRQKFTGDWSSVFASKLEQIPASSMCTFAGRYNRVSVNYKSSDRSRSIYCRLYCTNSSSSGERCPVFAEINSIGQPADLSFEARVHHERNHCSVKRRQLRGNRRKKEAEVIKQSHQKPSEREVELVNKEGRVAPSIPSKVQLRHCASEANVAERFSQDVQRALTLQHKLHHPQFIRSLSCIPFTVMLWTESMTRCYVEHCKLFGRPNLFMDATGGIVHRYEDQKSDVYLVSLVLPHPKPGQSQLPVAMLLTNSWTATDYTHFLQVWWRYMCDVYRQPPKPKSVTTDKNWPSMYAVTTVFNHMDMVVYLQTCFKIIERKYSLSQLREFTILGLGRAHFVNNVVHWKELFMSATSNRVLVLFWRGAVLKMVEMDSWSYIKKYLSNLLTLLHEEYFNERVQECHDFIVKTKDFDMDYAVVDTSETDAASSTDISWSSETESIYSQSPFYQEAVAMKEGRQEACCNSTVPMIPNPYRHPQLATKIITSAMPYVPLWSSIMANCERYAFDATKKLTPEHEGWLESYVEGFHRIMKHDILHKCPVLAQDFTTAMKESMTGRSIIFSQEMLNFREQATSAHIDEILESEVRCEKVVEDKNEDNEAETLVPGASPFSLISSSLATAAFRETATTVSQATATSSSQATLTTASLATATSVSEATATSSSRATPTTVSLAVATSVSLAVATSSSRPTATSLVDENGTDQLHQQMAPTTLQTAFLEKDTFKKKKTAPSGYLRTSMMGKSLEIQPIPLGGRVPIYSSKSLVHVAMSNTCCLDGIMMVLVCCYKDGLMEEISSSELPRALIDCVEDLSKAKSSTDALKARAHLLVNVEYFTKGTFTSPLTYNNKKKEYSINMEASEIAIAEALLNPMCKLTGTIVCERPLCSGTRFYPKKSLQVECNSITETIRLLTTEQPLGTCRAEASDLPRVAMDIDEQREMEENVAINDFGALPPLTTLVSDSHTRLSGAMTQKLQCIAQRTDTGVIYTGSTPPPLLLFTNPSDCDVDIEAPPEVKIFGETYIHRATTFLRRTKSVSGCGHYSAAIFYGNSWHMFDGLNRNGKPPYFTPLHSPTKVASRKGLTPSLVFYSLKSRQWK